MKKEIDFRIPGTKLPVINKNLKYSVVYWEFDTWDNFSYSREEYVSYGHFIRDGIDCIMFERKNYKGNNYFLFKESDIIELAKEQGMFEEERKLIGYKIKEELYNSVIPFFFGHNQRSSIEETAKLLKKEKINIKCGSKYEERLIKAKVLDIWCYPVYKEEVRLPVLHGYNGEDTGEQIVYGCKRFIYKDIHNLYNTLNNYRITYFQFFDGFGVDIDEVKEIVEYLNSKRL